MLFARFFSPFFSLFFSSKNSMSKPLKAKPLPMKKSLQEILERWEYETCKGSECYQRDDLKSAIMYFESALLSAQTGLENDRKNTTFMHYYALASMNLAHVLTAYEKQPQSEKVLSDAHFNMLTYMVDVKQPSSFRREAKRQAEVLLMSLKKFLVQIGKSPVAESLEDEFYRLSVNTHHGMLMEE